MKKMFSKSPYTGKQFLIPTKNDTKNIDLFLERNSGHKVVVVQGLGFVGTVMSLVCANSDKEKYAVLGLDLASKESYWKIASINNGEVPVVSSDPLIDEYYNNCMRMGNLYATYDNYAISKADVIVVDINLDVIKEKDINGNLKNYDVSLDNFRLAMKSIADYCKEDVLILVETTVPPGVCSRVIYPIIIDGLKRRGLQLNRIRLGHSYERVMPGPNYIDSIKNFYRVYSGINNESAEATKEFLQTIISIDQYPLTRLKTTEATEIAKVLENSYRAMNISFIIEWTELAEKSGVDLFEVIEAIRMRPTHANLMYPGIGVGGYCLTKDPLLASWASQKFFGIKDGLEFSTRAVEKNDQMPAYCVDFIRSLIENKSFDIKSIGMLGVAYGPNIADTRFSPVQDLYLALNALDFELSCHDPYVSYWEELSLDVDNSLEDFLQQDHDALIISTGHSFYNDSGILYEKLQNSFTQKLIIDTVGILDEEKIKQNRNINHNFFVLGRGDLII